MKSSIFYFFITVVEFISSKLIFSTFHFLKYLFFEIERNFFLYSFWSQFTKFNISREFVKKERIKSDFRINWFFETELVFTISCIKSNIVKRMFFIYFKTIRIFSIIENSFVIEKIFVLFSTSISIFFEFLAVFLKRRNDENRVLMIDEMYWKRREFLDVRELREVRREFLDVQKLKNVKQEMLEFKKENETFMMLIYLFIIMQIFNLMKIFMKMWCYLIDFDIFLNVFMIKCQKKFESTFKLTVVIA
jgi:hypothetical protein